MTLEEIKAAVDAGKVVHWATKSYRVVHDRTVPGGQWLITCDATDYCVGLTHRDGVTMNGKPEEFFIGGPTWEEFAAGRWTREASTAPGRYQACLENAKPGEWFDVLVEWTDKFGLLAYLPNVRGPAPPSRHGGWWWSVQMPDLPPPPPGKSVK